MSLIEAQDDLGVISEFSATCGRIARTSGVPLEDIQRLCESKNDPFWIQFRENLKRAAGQSGVVAVTAPVKLTESKVLSDAERSIMDRAIESNRKFWRDIHGIDLQLPDDVYSIFPRLVPGFDRYIVMPQIGLNAIYAGQSKSFKTWKNFGVEPEAFVTESERDAQRTGLYVILVRESVEPDSDLQNLSAKTVKQRKLKTETLAERLVHGHQFFFEKQESLDVNGWTICSGSRGLKICVPYVYWSIGRREVGVDWDYVKRRVPVSGSREVVAL